MEMKKIQQEKRQLRQRILKQRSALGHLYRKQASEFIAQKVLACQPHQKAHTVLYYVDFRDEVSTKTIIETAWQEGKRVCVPRAVPRTKELIICQITDWNQLQPGHYGVREPILDNVTQLIPSDLDLVISPGVAFDRHCNRLGYGGGYYDRFAEKLTSHCLRIALAFQCQIVELVPHNHYDIPIQGIMTEEEYISCSKGGGFRKHAANKYITYPK